MPASRTTSPRVRLYGAIFAALLASTSISVIATPTTLFAAGGGGDSGGGDSGGGDSGGDSGGGSAGGDSGGGSAGGDSGGGSAGGDSGGGSAGGDSGGGSGGGGSGSGSGDSGGNADGGETSTVNQSASRSGNGAGNTSAAVEGYYDRAVEYIEAKKYDDALPLLTEIIRIDPKHANAYNYMGFVLRKQGDFKASLSHYQTALKLYPKHRGAKEYLGELYLRMGDLTSAERLLADLDDQCFFGCKEYDELKKAVKDYKTKTKS